MGLVADKTIGNRETGEIEDFSLILGGPFYRLLLRLKLIEPPLGHLGWRTGVITSFVWLPLVVLSILAGRFTESSVNVPFLYDFEVHARLLFALPSLILAELTVYVPMSAITKQFIERRIITEQVRPAFDAVISSAIRLRNSLAPEFALFLVAVLIGPHLWRQALALHSDTWCANLSSSGLQYTSAGYWYAFISVPVFQFILLRWYYRMMIWYRFLFQVSRLDLNLVALHPDRCCGLGFLDGVAFSFAPLLMAHSGIIAGYIANRILQEGATLGSFRFELLGLAALLLAIVLGPLCVFIPKLNRAKLMGLRAYGQLASDYVVDFAAKWTAGAKMECQPLLGSADIQSLADLANSYAVVKEVKLVPFGKHTIIGFVVVIALPLSPLIFTMFSPEELLKRFITILL